ncbi:AraC family transcriptional regulator [Nocardia sp. NBC_01377]|uniref:AraC family transcriptional regulator n=1 Tax=Nocardia sp. NBC_01377 TaxID=2903595 RepID=UPI003243A0CA
MKPLAHYAALHGYVDLARSVGLDPLAQLRGAGLDPVAMSVQDRWIPAAAIADLLTRSARDSGRADFGLRLAERRRFGNLGPLGLVVREEPDVRSALRVISRHGNMFNEALRVGLTEHDGIAVVHVRLDLGGPGDTRQAVELSVGVLHTLLRGFAGPGWQPLEVRFAHPPPGDPRTHLRVFGSHVRFGQDFDGILTYTTDLDRPNDMSDPRLRAYTHELLSASTYRARPATTVERVRELVELLLPTGGCSIGQVARSLGVDRRTIHRHLAAEGETFTSLLDATRAELARHMITDRRRTITEIAESLGFSSPGNFSRWFRHHHGCTPTRWRNQPEPTVASDRISTIGIRVPTPPPRPT